MKDRVLDFQAFLELIVRLFLVTSLQRFRFVRYHVQLPLLPSYLAAVRTERPNVLTVNLAIPLYDDQKELCSKRNGWQRKDNS